MHANMKKINNDNKKKVTSNSNIGSGIEIGGGISGIVKSNDDKILKSHNIDIAPAAASLPDVKKPVLILSQDVDENHDDDDDDIDNDNRDMNTTFSPLIKGSMNRKNGICVSIVIIDIIIIIIMILIYILR